MYEVVPFEKIESGFYRIFVGLQHYYVADFVSLHHTAQFKNVYATFPKGTVRMFQDQYFTNNCVYHRFISKEEIQKYYQLFFERRAVNQIISSIINYSFLWY